jgi:tetratricopeptide (TPR) repeat protein
MIRAYYDGARGVAESLALEILGEAPGHKDALTALYNVRSGEENVTAAEALVRRLAILFPDDPVCQTGAARFFADKGDYHRATPHTRMLVRLTPQAAAAHILMGQVFNATHHPRAAEFHFRRAGKLGHISDPEIETGLALALRGQGRFEDARAALAKRLESGDLDALLAAASLEEADRKLDTASGLLDRATTIAPDEPRVALARATLHRRSKAFDLALAELDGLEHRLQEPKLRATAVMERGHVLDALGRHDEAFAAFLDFKHRAHEATGQVYGKAQAASLASRLKAFFTPEHSALLPRASLRADSAQPIFVLGFPRSGTTLVEQTLSSHPNIAGGGKLSIIPAMAERIPGLLGAPGIYPAVLGELWLGDRAGQIDTLRDLYLNEAARLGAIDPARSWFTDKMPLNETHLGLISLMFPHSPVIHLVRHPLDVVLSVFSNGLTHGFFCASALETAASHYVLIADLVEHYRAAMPLRYTAVRYEDMVMDQQAQVAAMFQFIGEPFDTRVLNFHENPRPARTASYAQVTEKLYDRSRYRYRNYLKHLEPMIPILEPAIRRLGYAVESPEATGDGLRQ